jgi:DNA-binding beta-propeller fold protein YncE
MRLVLCLTVAVATCVAVAVVRAQASLTIVARIALPNVKGRIDHLAFDAARQRLFVAALGNDTVEVVDTARNIHLASLPGFHEPQGLAVVPDLKGVAVANGATGTLQMIDAESYQLRWTTPIGGDADNVRFDAAAKRLYVAAQGGLFAVDPASGRTVGRISIAGHPESFQLESQGSRIFANLPGALASLRGGSQIVPADRKTMAAGERWPGGSCAANYPMALDETTGRVFVGCRRPATVTVFDTNTGKPIASVPAVGDADDLFYDRGSQLLYAIGGEGFVDVISRNGDAIRRVARVPTRAGARTGLWVAEQNRLYVAAPARGSDPAEILVLKPGS